MLGIFISRTDTAPTDSSQLRAEREPFANTQPALSDNADESGIRRAARSVAARYREWISIDGQHCQVLARSPSTPSCKDAKAAAAVLLRARVRRFARHTSPPRGRRYRSRCRGCG